MNEYNNDKRIPDPDKPKPERYDDSFNEEGYHDPTAHTAIRNVMRELGEEIQ